MGAKSPASSEETYNQIPEGSNKPTTKEVKALANIILTKGDILHTKKITAGFDGFVDTIVKVIRNKQPGAPPIFFETTTEFGSYIVEKGGSSFGLELEERDVKLGGNMPIMANSLGIFGIHVNCIGALGFPQIHKIFNNISSNCQLYSFASPGDCTAYEFNDGKIMFARMGELNSFGWEKIKKIFGIDTLIDLYESSDLLCIVNWSEIDVSSDIWKGLLKDVFPHYRTKKKEQTALFDLSDFSKRSRESIVEALTLLKAISEYAKVTLSLNKNETRSIFEMLLDEKATDNISEMGMQIFEKSGVEILLLHSPRQAIAINHEGRFSCDTFFVEHPKLSTGAGDHFNAGFSAARLLNLDMKSSLILANAVSAYYVETGTSPQLQDVASFLSAYKNSLDNDLA